MSLDGFILPKYLIRRKFYKCKNCSFRFFKDSPSMVEKCPKCNDISYDKDYKEGQTLDPYSASKLRWYQNENQHIDEIKKRKKVHIYGKDVIANTDGKGRIIDYLPTLDLKGTKVGKSEDQGTW